MHRVNGGWHCNTRLADRPTRTALSEDPGVLNRLETCPGFGTRREKMFSVKFMQFVVWRYEPRPATSAGRQASKERRAKRESIPQWYATLCTADALGKCDPRVVDPQKDVSSCGDACRRTLPLLPGHLLLLAGGRSRVGARSAVVEARAAKFRNLPVGILFPGHPFPTLHHTTRWILLKRAMRSHTSIVACAEWQVKS